MNDQIKYQLKILKNLLIAFGSIFVIFIVPILFSESYNFLNPDIDTFYAENFDEIRFNKIKPGSDTIAVRKLIGNPISKRLDDSTLYWSYTGDGKCTWFDFAWIARAVIFDKNGLVVETYKAIHYD